MPDPCVVCNDTRIDLHVMALGGGVKPCPVCDPPPHHNHDATGTYPNCPACGTAAPSTSPEPTTPTGKQREARDA